MNDFFDDKDINFVIIEVCCNVLVLVFFLIENGWFEIFIFDNFENL